MKKNTIYKLIDWLSSGILVVVILLCGSIALQTATTGYATICGYSLFRVVTGSMEPTLPVDTLVLVQQVEISEIQVEDIVSFVSSDSAISGKINTHRVIAISTDAGGELVLTTRGDANLVADSTAVTASALVGKVVWYSSEGNLLTEGMIFLTSKFGFIACIAVPGMILLTLLMRYMMLGLRRDIHEMLLEAQEQALAAQAEELFSPEEYEALYQTIKLELMKELGMLHESTQAIESNTGEPDPGKAAEQSEALRAGEP